MQSMMAATTAGVIKNILASQKNLHPKYTCVGIFSCDPCVSERKNTAIHSTSKNLMAENISEKFRRNLTAEKISEQNLQRKSVSIFLAQGSKTSTRTEIGNG